jgi:hypothetical protein
MNINECFIKIAKTVLINADQARACPGRAVFNKCVDAILHLTSCQFDARAPEEETKKGFAKQRKATMQLPALEAAATKMIITHYRQCTRFRDAERLISTTLHGKLIPGILGAAMQRDVPTQMVCKIIAAHPAAIKERFDGGSTVLHFMMASRAPVDEVRTIIAAWPGATAETDDESQTALQIGLLHYAPKGGLDCLRQEMILPLQMAQFSQFSVGLLPKPAAPMASFDKAVCALSSSQLLAAYANDSHKLIGLTDSGFEFKEQAETATPDVISEPVSLHFQKMMLDWTPRADAPLSERVAPIKDVLNNCVHYELQWASYNLYATVDCSSYQRNYIDPAIELISAELEKIKVEVSKDPARHRSILATIADEDHIIYDASFRKSIQHGNEAAYKCMLARCASLEQLVTAEKSEQQQPTSDLIELVLRTREHIPTFKTIVHGVVKQAETIEEAQATGTVIYRPHDQTKSPYRLIEKALTKGPNREYPDCSQILDVFGCLIDCPDYIYMAAVVDAFADQHARGLLRIVRMKGRWSNPSGGGWRDTMLNIAVNGMIFEVQIVLHSMYVARGALDAHKAYNQFRCFAEVFGMLGLPYELDAPEHQQQKEEEQEHEEESMVRKDVEAWCDAHPFEFDTLVATRATAEGVKQWHENRATLQHNGRSSSPHDFLIAGESLSIEGLMARVAELEAENEQLKRKCEMVVPSPAPSTTAPPPAVRGALPSFATPMAGFAAGDGGAGGAGGGDAESSEDEL